MAMCRKEKHFDLLHVSGTKNSLFHPAGVKSAYKLHKNMPD